MAWIPPELREGRGELEAAPPGRAARRWSTSSDIKGDLHMHTTASDGAPTAEEMAAAARERGLEYIAITDHSASHGFGDDSRRLTLERADRGICALNERMEGIEVLIGTESKSSPTARSTTPTSCSPQLDWVIASMHIVPDGREGDDRPHGRRDRAPAGRRDRPPDRAQDRAAPAYALDLERVIEAAERTGTMLEINAAPDRRDLDEIHAREAARAGVPVPIHSDAHSPRNLRLLRFGVHKARRAWLTRRACRTPARGPSSESCETERSRAN